MYLIEVLQATRILSWILLIVFLIITFVVVFDERFLDEEKSSALKTIWKWLVGLVAYLIFLPSYDLLIQWSH